MAKADVALITAGARRLGRAACLKLADMGYDIALHFHSSEEEAKETAELISQKGRRCELFQANLLEISEAESLVENVLSRMGEMSVLINNASIWIPSDIKESSASELQDNLGIHVIAPYILCRDFSKLCTQGQIINILDSAIVKNFTNFFPYLLSKKALHDLTLMLAANLAPDFRVNAIAPATMLEPEGQAKSKSSALPNSNPLKHWGSLEDYTSALEYLLTSNHVTGQCIYVAGGDQLQVP